MEKEINSAAVTENTATENGCEEMVTITSEELAKTFSYSKKVRSLYHKASTAYCKLIEAVKECTAIMTEQKGEDDNG